MNYNRIFGLPFVELCDFKSVSDPPEDVLSGDDSIDVVMKIVCGNKVSENLGPAPEGVTAFTNKNGYLHATMSKRVQISSLSERDLDDETHQFLCEVQHHFGIPASEYDSGTWMLVPAKNVAERLVEFCESDKVFATLVCVTGNGFVSNYYIYKLVLDANRVALMISLFPDCVNLGTKSIKHDVCQFGCYFEKEGKLCLFESAADICIYIGKYAGIKENRVVVFRQDTVLQPVLETLIEMVGTSMEKGEAYFSLFRFVQNKYCFTYDDVQDIIEGKTEWVGKCVDAIWSDTQNQQDIRQILFPESR